MRIILAQPRGFCAGVERAIEIVERALSRYGPPIYVRHHIVHNKHVIRELEKRGAVFVEDLHAIPHGARVILSAHGSSPAVKKEANERGLHVIDAVCPLVMKVHSEVIHLAKQGYAILLIGHRGHAEIEGTYGEAPEYITVIQDCADAMAVHVLDPEHVAYVTQTTLSLDDAQKIIRCLKERFPKIRAPAKEDICYAVQNRQGAVKKLAEVADVIFILGSSSSSNATRMREVAEKTARTVQAFLVESALEIPIHSLQEDMIIGISSGASTPEELVANAVERLRKFWNATVEELITKEEHVRFELPVELRDLRDRNLQD